MRQRHKAEKEKLVELQARLKAAQAENAPAQKELEKLRRMEQTKQSDWQDYVSYGS